jgi:type IV secretory pathway VirB10-like protein
LSWSFLQAIEQQLDRGNTEKATALAESAKAIVQGTPSQDEFKSLLEELFAPKPANKPFEPPAPPTTVSAPEPPGPRAQQAEVLLRDHADELNMAENQLEQAFLKAVREGSEAAFKRKEKLRNRLQKRTRWGGREPYKSTLKLLESVDSTFPGHCMTKL